MLISYNNILPQIDKSVLVCDGVKIIGDVHIGQKSSIWYNTVIRGDVNFIRIGERTNIQDGCILHVTHKKYALILESDITVGHRCILHGCNIKNNVLIGMGAIVLDNTVVNSNSLIAAGSVVKENFVIPEGVLAAGVPAKIIRDLKVEEIDKISQSAKNYVEYARNYMK